MTLSPLLPWSRPAREARAIADSQGKVVELTEQMRRTADELEKHNEELERATPHVGLYEPVIVNTGRGWVEAVLIDLDVSADELGRCILDGRLVDRRQFSRLVAPVSSAALA